jgi:anaerobic magnesium-protoporphyrin IX monomethyl ester cyclase
MNKVLITNSYFYRLDTKQWESQQPYPPLGTLQAAAILRETGRDIHFYDASLTQGPEQIASCLERIKPDYFIIYEDGFNYLTKMCLTVMRKAAFEMVTLAKTQGCVVVISSSDATDHREAYINHGADYVLLGEGDETIKELLLGLEEKKEMSDIPGLAFLKNGRIVMTRTRPVLRDLDSLPLPAWDLADLNPYRNIWKAKHGYFSLNIATTRGCPFKCNWCAKPIYGNRYNSRTPENVLTEIELLAQKESVEHYWMCDDIFGLKPDWIRRFSILSAEKNLRIRYKIQSRADLLVDTKTVSALASSGCEIAWIGAESGSQKILDAMEKGITVDQIRTATALLKKNGIKVGYFLQFGYPGETLDDIDMTINLMLEQMPDEIGISVSYPLPGTKFHENVKSHLREKHNWVDSDDLAMMYRSTFPAAYYRTLQRYVHSRYRIRRGVNRLTEFMRKPRINMGDFRKIASMIYHIPLSFLQSYRLKQHQTSHV